MTKVIYPLQGQIKLQLKFSMDGKTADVVGSSVVVNMQRYFRRALKNALTDATIKFLYDQGHKDLNYDKAEWRDYTFSYQFINYDIRYTKSASIKRYKKDNKYYVEIKTKNKTKTTKWSYKKGLDVSEIEI